MIALYGHDRGEGSFVQVTRGMRKALEAHDALATFVALEHDEYCEAADASISLNCGNPQGLLMAHRLGAHREHWLLLAPNGETLPSGFAKSLTAPSDICPRGMLDGGILAPSAWAKGVLARYFPEHPIIVAPHGVSPEVHYVREQQRERARKDYADGLFYCLHMTSGETERKGTAPLLTAWGKLKRSRKLPPGAVLVVVVPPAELSGIRWLGHKTRLTGEDMLAVPGFGLDQKGVVETFYSASHIVCQPSRGEGFGMIPLEAQACGVPVVATISTGHSEYLCSAGTAGTAAAFVRTGPLQPMDDFAGSLAPSVAVDDIADAILVAYQNWARFDAAAVAFAAAVQEQWAWHKVCARAVLELKERSEHVRDTRSDA